MLYNSSPWKQVNTCMMFYDYRITTLFANDVMTVWLVQGHHFKNTLTYLYHLCNLLLSSQVCRFLVNFCTIESKKTTSQDAPSADLAATTATIGDDGSSGKGCGHTSSSCHSLFSFLERCVSECIQEERGDPLLPGGPQIARAILLAVHAEVTNSTM